MKTYHYKALVESVDCGVKRAVVFEDNWFLKWKQASKMAIRQISSQTCIRCTKNHRNGDYCVIELERGEPDQHGSYHWRNVSPNDKNTKQMELGL